MTEDESLDAMAIQLRALAANMSARPSERKPLAEVLSQISGLPFLHPELFEEITGEDLPPRFIGGCSGAHS